MSYNISAPNPCISVIIPCYNAEIWLNSALRSLKHQIFKDFEVICVDDGSTDGTLSVLEKWKKCAELDINIISQKNSGVSKARNVGIEAAKGEYIVFLDADDVFNRYFLMMLYSAVKTENADIAYCRLSRNTAEVLKTDARGAEIVCHSPKQFMLKLLYEMRNYGFCCYIYNRKVIMESGLRFSEDIKFGEDREFNWKYVCGCKKAAWVNVALYGYRANNDSTTRKKSATWHMTDAIKSVDNVYAYMQERNCSFREIYRSYMYARVMWAAAKYFAACGDKKLFRRLAMEYDVKGCMKRLTKDKVFLVALASRLYLIDPRLFYYSVRIRGLIF